MNSPLLSQTKSRQRGLTDDVRTTFLVRVIKSQPRHVAAIASGPRDLRKLYEGEYNMTEIVLQPLPDQL
jgi:hypothetical protein